MDLTSQIGEAINAWLRGLAAQLLGPALDAAGQLLFQTPPLTRSRRSNRPGPSRALSPTACSSWRSAPSGSS